MKHTARRQTRHRRPRCSTRALRLAASLGVALDARGRPALTAHPGALAQRRAARIAPQLAGQLAPGKLVLLSGPSGSGKSTLLRAACTRAAHLGWRVQPVRAGAPTSPRTRRARVVDSSQAPAPAWLGSLARAGLAEAGVLLSRTHQLSDGQRARLAIARALCNADCAARATPTRRHLITIDEFAAALDRLTARSLCSALARWVRHHPAVCVILATAHDDVRRWLESLGGECVDLATCDTSSGTNIASKAHGPSSPPQQLKPLQSLTFRH